jgi:1-acyl-sn-glycerol-3-phosphate acyltransferase
MLRAPFVIVALVAITAALIPVQAAALFFNLRVQRTIPPFYHRMVCALLGVRARVSGKPMHGHPLLVVSNHTSWLDIPVITSVLNVCFVAKSEVAGWPLIGLLAKLQRSVFVERHRRHKTGKANAEIAQRLAASDAVVLFGEGTSSDGNRVLPFRSALMGAARDVVLSIEPGRQVFIQPLSIAYTSFQGLPMGRQHRPIAAWYGDILLFPHLMRIIRRGAIDVVVTWGEPISYEANVDRKLIAKTLQARVRQITIATLRGRSLASPAAQAGISFLPETR